MSTGETSARYFYLRRLHSLTGVIPLGLFLLDHFFTNAYSWSPTGFNEEVHKLNSLPLIQCIEYGGILLPLAFHAILGVWMAYHMDWNQTQYGNYRNWMYFLQRLTGVFLFGFILLHLAHFRFGHEADFKSVGLPMAKDATGGYDTYNPYGVIRTGLEGHFLGWSFPGWLVLGVYALGITCAAFHFANGIWSFCVTWGITIGRRSQQLMSYATAGIFVVVLLFGGYALYGFVKQPSETSLDAAGMR